MRRQWRFGGAYSIVRHNGCVVDSTAIDVGLMTMYKHFFVANGSFSCWTAWLGVDAEKAVIAPAESFRSDK